MKLFQKPILLFLAALPLGLFAQMGNAYEMNVNGVKVIVQPSGNDIVEVLTIIKGGVQNYPAAKAGIEALAMTALTECGTKKDDKNSFKNKLDKVSAQIGGYTGMDYASFRMNCIKSDFDIVWPLYVDAMTIPKFDAKEFSRIKQDAVTSLKAAESNPDVALDRMAKGLAFAGKAYAKDPQGTVEIVSKLTAAETAAYYKSIFNRGRMVMVVVGDVDSATLAGNIRKFIAMVPAGKPFTVKKDAYIPPANTLKSQQKELATNYILGITGAPQPGTKDYNAYVLAMRIFSTKHFLEVRSNNGLSYAPQAWFNGGLTPYTNIYVTTTQPDKYAIVARQLIDKLKKEGFSEEELKNQMTGYLTNVYYRQETASAQASSLANNEVVHNNWRRANTIKDDMKAVTVEDLNRVFNKYVSNITWAYQGDPKKVDSKLFTQKETPQTPSDVKTF
jgi:predicted Zn-dependent peptidase